MILNDGSIRKGLASGSIVIDPPPHDADIQPASVNLHISTELKVQRWDEAGLLEWQTVSLPYEVQSGEFVLASTSERIGISPHLAAKLEGRSTVGRKGLLVHITAGFVDPGFRGQLTLEVCNLSSTPYFLSAGDSIAQICFFVLTAPAERPYGSLGLRSRYQDQEGPTEAREKAGTAS